MKSKLLTIFLITLLVSCSDEFLDRKPKGNLTSDTFFENEEQAIWAVNAIYANFRSWEYCGLPYLGATDIISDDADKGSTENDGPYLNEMDQFLFNPTNETFSTIWKGHYRTISRANIAINRIPAVQMPETLKARILGEAKFLRAFNYFRLVQWFGDLPLITSELTDDVYFTQKRSPKEDVYKQIEKDLLDAISSLPERSKYTAENLGRATKGAAKGILAKLYMLQNKYTEALNLCEEIISSNEYSLLQSYGQIFTAQGENGSESIFEIGAVALQASIVGSGATPYNMVQGVRGVPNLGWGFNRPSDDLISNYESGDPRRQATIIYVGEVLPDGQTIVQDNPEILNERFNQKAWVGRHAGLQDNGPGNIRILRLADIILLAAEAANELGQTDKSLQYINIIRKRARSNNNFILKDLTTTDNSKLRQEIRRERRSELALEQHRWFDLLRWGIAEEVMTKLGKGFIAPKHEVFPLPQTEIDLSGGNLSQNPGY